MAGRLLEGPPRYQKTGLGPIGFGAFGRVWKVEDTASGSVIDNAHMNRALKEQSTDFNIVDRKDKPVLALRAYRELLFLRTFRGHPNIIYVVDVFSLWVTNEMNQLCIITELMDMDLKAAVTRKLIPRAQTSFVIHAILCGLKYIHSIGVLHRDLKPTNIGVTVRDGRVLTVKLLDFGLARKLRVDMSHIVQTLSYRAPEVWFRPGKYSPAIDVWSVGCMLAEIVINETLMDGSSEPVTELTTLMPTSPGTNGQLKKIHSHLGSPGPSFIENEVHRSYHGLFYELAKEPYIPVLELDSLSTATEQEKDILKHIFIWKPEDRWTTSQCLAHPYFAELVRQHGDGGVYTGAAPDDSFEDRENVSLQEWKNFVDTGIEAIRATL